MAKDPNALIEIPVVQPSQFTNKGMRSSLPASQLPDGMVQLSRNRRIKYGVWTVRDGVSSLTTFPKGTTFSPTTTRGMWAGTLNGTPYAVMGIEVSGKTRVYVYDTTDGWLELTGVGGWFGAVTAVTNSRFETGAADLQFAAVRTPDTSPGGTFQAGRDVLVIQNGNNNPRIYDPQFVNAGLAVTGAANSAGLIQITTGGTHYLNTGDTVVVQNVGGVPNATGSWTITRTGAATFTLDGSTFAGAFTAGGTVKRPSMIVHNQIQPPDYIRTIYGFTDFFQVATAVGGKTYPAATGTGNFTIANTGAPYNVGNDYGFLVTAGVACADADTAQVVFPAAVSLRGPQVAFYVEDGVASVECLKQCKIEFRNGGAGTYYTVYDPTDSTSPWLNSFFSYAQGTGNVLVFSMKHISTSVRTFDRMRLTWKGNPPTLAQSANVLMVASCGSFDTCFPGGTSFAGAFVNSYSFSESPGIVTSEIQGKFINQMGGPSKIRVTGTTLGVAQILSDSRVFFDYNINAPNPGTTQAMFGDSQPYPSDLDFYALLPGGSDYYKWTTASYRTYGIGTSGGTDGALWLAAADPATVTTRTFNTKDSSFGPGDLDSSVVMPTSFCIPMPPAGAILSANKRAFVGAVKDGATAISSDVYVSEEGSPFRFQAIQTGTFSGTRMSCQGEKIQAIVSTAAAAQGASTVFIITDQSTYAVGNSSPFMGSLLDSTALSVLTQVAPYGTYSPKSVCQLRGAIFWVDQYFHVLKMYGGQIENLSRNRIEDKLALIPTARISNLVGAIRQDRYYLAYTPAGETTNRYILVWNDVYDEWEADDEPPEASRPEHMAVWRDTTADGVRQSKLLVLTKGALAYKYETEGDTQDNGADIASQITFKQFSTPTAGMALVIDNVEGVMSVGTGYTANFDRYYTSPSSQFRTTLALSGTELTNNNGWFTDNNKTHTAISGTQEGGYGGYLSVTASSKAGAKIERLILQVQPRGTIGAQAV